jgi:HAD superfamily hydrolase (TIGR01549 family)
MTIKAATFDVGDTLLRLGISRATAFAGVAQHYNYDITPAQVEPLVPKMNAYLAKLIGNDLSFNADEVRAQAINIAKYEYLCKQLGITANCREIACAVQEVYNLSGSWQLIPKVLETLGALRDQGLRLAIISNWTKNLEGILQALGLSRYFKCIIVSTVVELYKPQPEIFHLAATKLGIEPYQCLHVGDSIDADVNGALAAGFKAVLFDPTGMNQNKNNAAPTITALPELLQFI